MTGQVADYVATLRVSEKEKQRISHRLNDSLEYFSEHGITEPCEVDYQRLKEWLLQQPGKRKGTTMGTPTVNDWVSATKKFYEWRARSNQRDIFSELNDDEQESEDMSEVSVIAVPEQAEAVSENLAVDGENPAPDVKKRGRKANPEKADRVQVSVYLPRATYEAVRDLAAHEGKGISDVLARLAFFFTENNADTLALIREVKKRPLTYER